MTSPPPPPGPPRPPSPSGPPRPLASDGLRAALLYLFAWPLPLAALVSLFLGRLDMVAGTAGAFGLVILASSLIARGLAARRERRPAEGVPRPLTLGAAVVGLAGLLAAWLGAGYGGAMSVLFGIASGIGTGLLFGLDEAHPRPAPPEGASPLSADERRLLAEARNRVKALETAARTLASPEFRDRLGRVAGWAGAVVAEIERDPRDLRRARKALTVYLDGAEKVTTKYLQTHPRAGDQQGALEQSFRTLLEELERAFAEQHAKLLQNDTMDLDVQIEVLTTRLKREGVM
ncbi:5-bromo-4-chloroindolyl phosphate hydrolysis family protein [Elioraea sp.]|uniref:5-bromo-4-chloroindolyl phosphate hydrolysis family protein n=1 Tax=Elioraea sp. TaxID=2185103 RepID=UPI0021DD8928|nr:5-bromo-4-chloroindolyl phosphate hydrolysis family protein [Elioraea sp.]GIX11055.1 MAG: hypothetical protein KatS3mg116_2765 [Elioraea sp.]